MHQEPELGFPTPVTWGSLMVPEQVMIEGKQWAVFPSHSNLHNVVEAKRNVGGQKLSQPEHIKTLTPPTCSVDHVHFHPSTARPPPTKVLPAQERFAACRQAKRTAFVAYVTAARNARGSRSGGTRRGSAWCR